MKTILLIFVFLIIDNLATASSTNSPISCKSISFSIDIRDQIKALKDIESTVFINLTEELNRDEATFLKSKFKVAYMVEMQTISKFNQEIFEFSHLQLNSFGLNVELINRENAKDAVVLFMRIIRAQPKNDIPEEDLQIIETKLFDFLVNSKSSLIYKINGTPVGLLGIWPQLTHPMLNDVVNHIGAIGYDKNLVSIDQARSIKSHWQETLNSVLLANFKSANRLTARIDLFNLPSLNLFRKFGFNIFGLVLEPL